jgi:hypothetical protein
MGKKLEELLDVAIALGKTAITYLNMKAIKEGLVEAPQKETPAAERTNPTPTRPKREKATAPGEKKPETTKTIEAAVEPELDEKEAQQEAFRLANAYIQSAIDKGGNKDAAVAELRKWMKDTYNKPQISALSHAERLEFIKFVKNGAEAEPVL